MKQLRNGILISLFLYSIPLNAATEFADDMVPIELAKEFIGGDIYRSLPDDFPVPALPADIGLKVIGSIDMGGFHQQLLLRSSEDSQQTLDRLVQAYTDAGWIDLSLIPIPSATSLCHDQFGRLNLHRTQINGVENGIRADLSKAPFSSSSDILNCAQQLAFYQSQLDRPNYQSFITSLLPVLEVPEQTVATHPAYALPSISISRVSSFISSGTRFSTSQEGSIEVPDYSVAELHEHFAVQLEAQDWQPDSTGLGQSSASSIWFRTAQTPATAETPAEDLELTGVMTLLHTEGDSYQVSFHLQSGMQSGSQGGFTDRPIGVYPPGGVIEVLPPLEISRDLPSLGIRGISPHQ